MSLFNLDLQSNNVFLLFIMFLIIACVSRIILLWMMLRFSHTIGNDMGILMFGKILGQPMEFHFSAPTSEIISNLTKKIHILSMEIVHPIILVSSNIIIISVVLAYLLYNTGIEVFIILILLALIFYFFWVTSKSKILRNKDQNNFSKFRPFGQDYFRNNICYKTNFHEKKLFYFYK